MQEHECSVVLNDPFRSRPVVPDGRPEAQGRTDLLLGLILAHLLGARPAGQRVPVEGAAMDAFALRLLTSNFDESLADIDALQARGWSREAILLDLLAPAARRLGQMWETDECDFVDVAMGLGRLQALLQVYNPAVDGRPEPRPDSHRLLLAAAPGEAHDFGLAIVESFFQSEGWWVDRADPAGPLARLGAMHYDVAGFTLGSPRHAGALCATIAESRAVSRNRDLLILVGGAAFSAEPELVHMVGADAMAEDAPSAVELARSLLIQRAHV